MDLTRLREQVSLEGKVAIVTGAFHKGGIGLAAAKELAARGAEIVLTDRPPYAAYAGAAQAALKKMGSYAVGVTADTDTPEGAKQVADAALNAFGAIDILINTAPLYCDYRRIEQVPDQDWQAAYEGNILGTAEICRAVIPHMAKRGGGSIVNQLSVWGNAATEGLSCYGISQAFLLGLSRTLATEHGNDKIRVNAVLCGYVDTPELRSAAEAFASTQGLSASEILGEMEKACSMGRLGRPEEIAAIIGFLSSEAAGYINGATLYADGGLMSASIH